MPVRPPEYHLLDAGVAITGRVADYLERRAHLDDFRLRVRGIDPDLDSQLLALHMAALRWRGSGHGTQRAEPSEPVTTLERLSTTEAADLLHLHPRSVVKAIHEGRLEAEQVGRGWRIHRRDLHHFQAARTSRR